MPLFDVRCVKCGHVEEIFRKASNIDDVPSHCGERMEKLACAPAVMADIQPYQSMATGEMIESRSKHREHLRAHGLVEIGDQHKAHQKQLEEQNKQKEKQQAIALRKEIAARLDSLPR